MLVYDKEENSFIIGYFFVEESYFDELLNQFDDSGNCKLEGVECTKEEIIKMMEEVRQKNKNIEQRKLEHLKAFIIKHPMSEDQKEFMWSKLNESIKNKEMIHGFEGLEVPVKIDVLDLDNDEIKEMVMKGFYATDNWLINTIYIDAAYYGLNILSDQFASEIDKDLEEFRPYLKRDDTDVIISDAKKREEILKGILDYKQSVTGNQY